MTRFPPEMSYPPLELPPPDWTRENRSKRFCRPSRQPPNAAAQRVATRINPIKTIVRCDIQPPDVTRSPLSPFSLSSFSASSVVDSFRTRIQFQPQIIPLDPVHRVAARDRQLQHIRPGFHQRCVETHGPLRPIAADPIAVD